MSSYLTIELWAAKEFGFSGAAVLAQALQWDAYVTREGFHEHEGFFWFEHTRKQWFADLEEAVPIPTLRKALDALIAAGLLAVRYTVDNFAFYRVNYDVYDGRRANSRTRPRPYTKAQRKPDGGGPSDLSGPRGEGGSDPTDPRSDPTDPRSLPLEKEKEESKEGSVSATPSACGAQVILFEDLATLKAGSKTASEVGKGTDPNRHLQSIPNVKPGARNKPHETTEGTKIWEAYREAYRAAYLDRDGNPIEPLRNAAAKTACARLAVSMPLDEAIALAHFYLTCRTAFYLSRSHDVLFLARDASTLRTQMMRGVRVTAIGARQGERQAEMHEQLARLSAEDREGGSPW